MTASSCRRSGDRCVTGIFPLSPGPAVRRRPSADGESCGGCGACGSVEPSSPHHPAPCRGQLTRPRRAGSPRRRLAHSRPACPRFSESGTSRRVGIADVIGSISGVPRLQHSRLCILAAAGATSTSIRRSCQTSAQRAIPGVRARLSTTVRRVGALATMTFTNAPGRPDRTRPPLGGKARIVRRGADTAPASLTVLTLSGQVDQQKSSEVCTAFEEMIS